MSIFNEPREQREVRPMAMAAIITGNQLLIRCSFLIDNLIWQADKKYFKILAEHQGVDIKDYQLAAIQMHGTTVQLIFEKVQDAGEL